MANFTLNTSTLSGDQLNYTELPINEVGRAIRVEMDQPGGSIDFQVHGYAIRYVPGELMSQSPTGTS